MILHFLARDLKSHRLHWLLIALVTLVGLPFASSSSGATLLLGYAYFFFALTPMNQLMGFTWRSQHVMSRNYLLSLPLSRDRLYAIIQIRAGVFWLPFLGLMLVAPLAGRLHVIDGYYATYAVSVVLFAVCFTNSTILWQLRAERISGNTSPTQRMLGHSTTLLILFGQLTLSLCAVGWHVGAFERSFRGLSPALGLLLIAVVTIPTFAVARWRWQGR